MIRVLVVDKCPIVGTGLESILRSINIVKDVYVSDAATFEGTSTLAARLLPDFVFIDPRASNEDWSSLREAKLIEMEVCRKLKTLPSSPRVIGYSECTYPADFASLMLAGIDGYIDKSTRLNHLDEALNRVFAHKPVWLFALKTEQYQKALSNVLRTFCLSPQEEKVFILLLTRISIKEIADTLYNPSCSLYTWQ